MGAGLQAGELRQFTSADGQKTLRASITNVVAAKDGSLSVELELAGGKTSRGPATAFSEEDQSHIREVWIAREAGRNLRPTIQEVTDRGKGKAEETRGRKISKSETRYAIDLRNNGTVSLEGLEIEYVIFWNKAKEVENKRVAKDGQTTTGKISADPIEASASRKLTTEGVTLVSDRPNLGGPGCTSTG